MLRNRILRFTHAGRTTKKRSTKCEPLERKTRLEPATLSLEG